MSINPISATGFCAITLTLFALGGGMAEARPNRDFNIDSNPSNSSLLAQRGQGQRGQNRQDRLMESLNLSSQQQQQMQAIKSRYEPQFMQQKEQVSQAREQLRNLMTGNASESQIRSQYQQVQRLTQQMGNLRFESMMEIRALLDPAQRQQLGEMMEGKRDRSSNRQGNR